MDNLNSNIDIVRPDLEKWMADDIVDFFRKDDGFKNVPDFMIRDVFKTYYNPQEGIKYECNEMMYWWHEMLQNTNNYLLKSVTINKPGYSFIATKHIINLLREEIEKDENFKDKANDPNGQGDPDQGNGDGQPDMNKINQNIQDKMEQASKQASDEIQQKEDAQEAMGGGDLAGKGPTDIEMLEEKMDMIKDVILNKNEVGRLIKRSIKGFKSGFGTRHIVTEESLFEADVVDDLIDQHYLFDEILAMDVNVRDHKSQMVAFDLYIDISGSMSSSMNIYGKNVSRMNMAIALTSRMNNMGCLGELYTFNRGIQHLKDVENIWKLRPSGGTDIERCMKQIKKNGRPSVILTDGEDGFETYTENAFIMSISPSSGNGYFKQPACAKMVKGRKYIQYNGKNLITPKLK
jgi:hypothetical protein